MKKENAKKKEPGNKKNRKPGEVNMQRVCKKCLLREMAEADKAMIEKYKSAIKESDQPPAEEYERRLEICKECERLNAGTCDACGCYVELRAASRISHCPYKKW